MFIKYQTVRALFLVGAGLVVVSGYLLFVNSGSKNLEDQRRNAEARNVAPLNPSGNDFEELPVAPAESANPAGDVDKVVEATPKASAPAASTSQSSGATSSPQTASPNPLLGAQGKKESGTPAVAGSKGAATDTQGDDAKRLVEAMKIANSKATTPQGKDVLGKSSPWKLNLYDDNSDGQWDRAKLDTNRDDIDDEKWNYKEGRWEKEGGGSIWNGDAWVASTPSSAGKSNTNAGTATANKGTGANTLDDSARYREAMKIATGKATSGKGKDVLGAKSPWKLNLYDDDNDGKWDRGKLDKNRDDVDDEKWNFKNGRWERDGGASTWDGDKWSGS